MAVHILGQAQAGNPTANWREQLPVLRGGRVVLREMRMDDAAALVAIVTPVEVSRYISPPPPTVPLFERFVLRSRAQQAAGTLACFVVTLKGHDTPIGLFQIRQMEPAFKTAEWGFALSAAFWGTGLFEECADLVLEFAFGTLGAHRVEARAAVRNGRGNRALQKVGAVQEGVLRQAFLCGGEYLDQILYAIVEDEWRAARAYGTRPTRVVVH
jgi:RimJ/RimL family protein N-acetyltransferase